jgi:hypothetical protein
MKELIQALIPRIKGDVIEAVASEIEERFSEIEQELPWYVLAKLGGAWLSNSFQLLHLVRRRAYDLGLLDPPIADVEFCLGNHCTSSTGVNLYELDLYALITENTGYTGVLKGYLYGGSDNWDGKEAVYGYKIGTRLSPFVIALGRESERSYVRFSNIQNWEAMYIEVLTNNVSDGDTDGVIIETDNETLIEGELRSLLGGMIPARLHALITSNDTTSVKISVPSVGSSIYPYNERYFIISII